jgi:hypothetical protein
VSADWPDDPAYQAATAPGTGSRYEQLLTPELWLPCPFGFVVRTQDVTGEEIQIGSSVALLDQLELLRPATAWTGRRPGATAATTAWRRPPPPGWPCCCGWPSGRSATACRCGWTSEAAPAAAQIES